MSEKVTKEQASNLLAAAEKDENHYLQRYSQTIVDQYEQIERLQNALARAKELMKCPVCEEPRRKKLSGSLSLLVTCGKSACAGEMRGRKTRGRIYGEREGGPFHRKEVVSYTGAHDRARKTLGKKEKVCSLPDSSCKGRIEAALRPDAPKEYLYEHRDQPGVMYYSGPNPEDGYRYLCRSHHVREGAANQVISRISDPALAEAVRKDLGM